MSADNYLTHPAEVMAVIDERRQWWRPWRKVPVKAVVWRGYIVGYSNDYRRGPRIELSDLSYGLLKIPEELPEDAGPLEIGEDWLEHFMQPLKGDE